MVRFQGTPEGGWRAVAWFAERMDCS